MHRDRRAQRQDLPRTGHRRVPSGGDPTDAADPPDFDQFWAAGKAALAKLPIDARVTPLPDYGNALSTATT